MTATPDRCLFEREPGAFKLADVRRAKNRPGVARTGEDDPARVRYIEEALAKRERKDRKA